MLRVCSIVQEYYPKDIRVRKQCETLSSNRFEVTVICLRDKNEKKYEFVNGVHVYRVNLRKKRGSKLRYVYEYLAFFVLAFFKLNMLDLEKRYDIIQVSTLPDFLVFSTIIQKLRGAKIVLDMHEIMPEFFMSKYGKDEDSFFIKVLKFIEKLSLRYSDKVITINDSMKKVFNERSVPGKEIIVVMNTVDESVIPSFEKVETKEINLVYHGTVSDIYGLDVAIRALKELSEKSFKFYIFGEGPSVPYLKDLVSEFGLENRVLFKGYVPYSVVIDFLRYVTLGILPIKKDVFLNLSFSNKLAEYVYLKIPVIISDLDSIKYYFSDDELTYFESGNVKDLARKLDFAFSNLDIMNRKAERAFQRYQSIKWSVMAERYLSLMKDI